MSEELKPCPFCGEYSQMVSTHSDHSYHFVECGSCEAEGPPKKKKTEAIAAWNTRNDKEQADE